MRCFGWIRGLGLVGAVALGGCYIYTPVETPTPGSEVRVVIPVQSAAEGLRTNNASVTGKVVSSGETIVLETVNRQTAGFMQDMVLVDTLRMARRNLISVEERSFSRGRTVAFSVGVTVGAFLALKAIQSVVGGDAGDEPGGGNGTSAQRAGPGVDILRIPWPLGGR